MKSDRPEPPRFIVSVSEILIGVAYLSGFNAFLLLGVNGAREQQQLPPYLPQLKPLYEHHPWLFLIGSPIAVTAIVGAFLAVVRVFLPKAVRAHFVWRKTPRNEVG